MARARTIGAILLLALLPWVTASGAVASMPSQSFPIEGWLELDAEGRLHAFEEDSQRPVPAPLLAGAREQLATLAFQPARRDGEPAGSRSWLTARVVLQEEGDEYVLTLQDARLGPKPLHRQAPRIALAGRRSISLVVDLTVDVQGRPVGVHAESLEGADRRQLDAAMAAISAWRFEPERVAGEPIASSMRLPVRVARSPKDLPTTPMRLPESPLQAGRPGAPGQDGYVDVLEILGSPVGLPRRERPGT